MKKPLAIILTCFSCVVAAQAYDERIWLDAKINDQPVRFGFDTGSGCLAMIYSTSAKRLGLKTTSPDPRYPKIEGITWKTTAPVNFDLEPLKLTNICLPVYVVPDGYSWPEDGIIGWPFIRQYSRQPLLLDAATDKLTWLTHLPTGLETWSKFQIATNLEVLALRVYSQKGKTSVLVFDAGTPCGVKFGTENLQAWAMNHTNQPTTYDAFISVKNEIMISAQVWAKNVSIGTLNITDVPLEGADPNSIAAGTSADTQFYALLGMAALKRLDVIIDNQNNIAYLRPKTTPPIPYQHNRLGAVFTPKYPDPANYLANVIKGSPAYNAGIRDNDILLNQEVNGNFEQPAGTKINFTLKRGDKIFKTTATLQNLLPPDSMNNSILKK